MEDQRIRLKKWLIRFAKLAVLALVIWALRHTFVNAWHQLKQPFADDGQSAASQFEWQVVPHWLAIAVVFYLLALLPCGWFWYRILQALGQKPRWLEAIRAYYIGHLGKYVPGKAMVVVLRAALVRSDRVDAGVAAAAVFLETLTWIAVGSSLAAGYLAVYLHEHTMYLTLAVGLMIATGLPTCPPVFTRLARLARVGKSDPVVLEKLKTLGYGTLLKGWTLGVIAWTFMGLTYWATLHAMGIPVAGPLADLRSFADSVALFTASVALATVAGFVVLAAPGGIGVREAALIALLTPYLREVTDKAELVAVISAALMRLVSIVSEASISGILYATCLRRTACPPAESLQRCPD